MSEEDTTALVPEAPVSEDAAPQQEAPAHDPFEQRYNSLRPQWDRTNALLDRARQGDLEAIRELNLPYEDPEDEPEPDYEDPYAAKLAEYERSISELSEWKQQQEVEKIAASISSHVDQLAQSEGVSLTDADKEYIFGRAAGGDKIGAEQTEAAFKAHLEYVNSLRSAFEAEYIPTKRAQRPGAGQAASKTFDPMTATDQERQEWMIAQLQDGPAT